MLPCPTRRKQLDLERALSSTPDMRNGAEAACILPSSMCNMTMVHHTVATYAFKVQVEDTKSFWHTDQIKHVNSELAM